MDKQEAIEWMKGERSCQECIPQDPHETWVLRIAEADAAMVKMAYYYLKAEKEGLVESEIRSCYYCSNLLPPKNSFRTCSKHPEVNVNIWEDVSRKNKITDCPDWRSA